MKTVMIFILMNFFFVSLSFSQSDTITLHEVEISNFRDANTLHLCNRLSLKNIEQTSLSDVGSFLLKIPNVSGIKKGAVGVDPVMRGFKYSQLNVLIDGTIKIEGGCPNRMDPAAAHVDINEIREINVIKGPFALKYGPAFGGVINMVTWRPVFYKQNQIHLKGIVGLQSNGFGAKSGIDVNGGNKQLTYQVAAGAKKYGDYRDGDSRPVKASMTNYHFNTNIGFKINKKHIVDVGVTGSFGRNVDFSALSMDEREDNTLVYKANYLGMNLGNIINFVKVNTWFSDVHHLMDNKNRPFSDTVVAVSTIDAKDAGVRCAINISLGSGILQTGADYEHIFKDGERVKTMVLQVGMPIKTESIWSNANISNIGIYSEYQVSQKSMDWIVAGRLDFNYASSDPLVRKGLNDKPVFEDEDTGSSFTNLSLNGGFTWHIDDNYRLMFSLGRGVRSADMTERFIILLPVGYDKFDYLGNPRLKPETNYETDLGFAFTGNKKHELKANLFFSYVTDFIGSVRVPPSVVRPQTKGVLGVKQFVNFDWAWLTGFEFSYSSPKQNPWQININAAYTFGINPKTTGYNTENGHITDEYTLYNDPLPEIPPLEINTSFRYKFLKGRLLPVIDWRLVSAQKQISQSYGEQVSKAFQTVNVSLKYDVVKGISVWAGVNNLFNATYYEHLNRNILGSDLPLYEPGRNFYLNIVFKF